MLNNTFSLSIYINAVFIWDKTNIYIHFNKYLILQCVCVELKVVADERRNKIVRVVITLY